MTEPALYLVYLEAEVLPRTGEDPHLLELAPCLYLVESPQTRSRLYHALKRRHAPRKLLVAPLADAPKFKGMSAGALKWLRDRQG